MTAVATAPLTIDDPAYFARLAEMDAAHWWSAGMWRIAECWLDCAIAGRRELVALDVGCGAGGTMARLSRRREFARVVGVDPSDAALGHASCAATVLGSALALPFANQSFDVVTCLDVFQHLPPGGDIAAATEIRRVARPGGVVIIRANGRGLWPDETSETPPYRLDRLIGVMHSAGFHVRAATHANCLPAVVSEIIERWRPRSIARSTRFGHPSGRGLRARPGSDARNRIMGTVASAEAFLVGRLGLRLPVGHSTMMLAVTVPEWRRGGG